MENELDEIANGGMTWNAVMNGFYPHFAAKLQDQANIMPD